MIVNGTGGPGGVGREKGLRMAEQLLQNDTIAQLLLATGFWFL